MVEYKAITRASSESAMGIKCKALAFYNSRMFSHSNNARIIGKIQIPQPWKVPKHGFLNLACCCVCLCRYHSGILAQSTRNEREGIEVLKKKLISVCHNTSTLNLSKRLTVGGIPRPCILQSLTLRNNGPITSALQGHSAPWGPGRTDQSSLLLVIRVIGCC